MINLSELNPEHYEVTDLISSHLLLLLFRIHQLEMYTDFHFQVTSGLRSDAKQQELIKAGLSTAVHSKHLTGQAVDIYDPKGILNQFCKSHPQLLEQIQLWCEERQGPWQHFQTVPPVSNHRWFKP